MNDTFLSERLMSTAEIITLFSKIKKNHQMSQTVQSHHFKLVPMRTNVHDTILRPLLILYTAVLSGVYACTFYKCYKRAPLSLSQSIQ